MSSDAFNDRVAQAKRAEREALLKELGVSSPDEVKAALAAKKAVDDAKKTEADKNAELNAQLAAERAKTASLEGAVKARADYELGQLDDAKKAAVTAIAGTDAAAQLRAIEALRPTWAQQPTPPAPAGKPPLAAPVSTTGAPPGPAANATPVEPVNYAKVYDELKVKNPMLASSFYSAHAAQISDARKQAAST
jgi:hypothetical protein